MLESIAPDGNGDRYSMIFLGTFYDVYADNNPTDHE